MRSPGVRVALAGIGLAVLATDAGALPCRTKRGEVIWREACRAKEQPVALADFGLPGAPGGAGAPGPPGRAPLYLVDAADREVGPVVFAIHVGWNLGPGIAHAFALVRRDDLGGAALLGAGNEGETVGTVLYTTDDCSGTPRVDAKTFMPVLQVIGDTVFRPTGPPGGAVMIRSTETDVTSLGCTSRTPRGGCCRTLSPFMTDGLSPAATVTGLGFTPPLRTKGP